MVSLYACDLHVSICSMWDPSASWTRCKRTKSLSAVSSNMSSAISSATPELWPDWCDTHDLWGSPTGNNHRNSCPVNMVARTTHTRSALQIDSTEHGYETLWRMSWTTYAVCGCAPSCWTNVVFTCPAPWMNGVSSFGSCCRYPWFVQAPSTGIGSVNPCLLIAHITVHFAGWNNVSTAVWIFRGPNLVSWLFTNPSRWKWASSLNHRQSVVTG